MPSSREVKTGTDLLDGQRRVVARVGTPWRSRGPCRDRRFRVRCRSMDTARRRPIQGISDRRTRQLGATIEREASARGTGHVAASLISTAPSSSIRGLPRVPPRGTRKTIQARVGRCPGHTAAPGRENRSRREHSEVERAPRRGEAHGRRGRPRHEANDVAPASMYSILVRSAWTGASQAGDIHGLGAMRLGYAGRARNRRRRGRPTETIGRRRRREGIGDRRGNGTRRSAWEPGERGCGEQHPRSPRLTGSIYRLTPERATSVERLDCLELIVPRSRPGNPVKQAVRSHASAAEAEPPLEERCRGIRLENCGSSTGWLASISRLVAGDAVVAMSCRGSATRTWTSSPPHRGAYGRFADASSRTDQRPRARSVCPQAQRAPGSAHLGDECGGGLLGLEEAVRRMVRTERGRTGS